MDYDTIVNQCKELMDKAIEHLKKEFRSLRTGRASPALVENVQFDYYGSKQPLKNAATISVQDATTLIIKPFDASQIKVMAKAITDANLGLNPIDGAESIRISLPPMTEETRKKIAAQVKDQAEQGKVSIRNARQDANKKADASLKDKDVNMTEDEHRDLKEEIQELTNKYNKNIEELMKAKVEDVMSV